LIQNNGTGRHVGVLDSLSGTGNANQYAILNYLVIQATATISVLIIILMELVLVADMALIIVLKMVVA
jgi:hypothetical protein